MKFAIGNLDFLEARQPAEQFRLLADRLVHLAEREEVAIRAYHDESLPIFSSMPEQLQLDTVERFAMYVGACEDVRASGGALSDSPLLMMKMIKRLGLQPTSDLYAKIKEDSVVEIYSRQNIQIFRNMRFFEICSYTLEELMCKEWWQLYDRDDVINREIFLWASRVFGQEVTGTCEPTVPRHVLVEKSSPRRFGMHVDLKYLSPLSLNDEIHAAVAIESADIFSSRPIESDLDHGSDSAPTVE